MASASWSEPTRRRRRPARRRGSAPSAGCRRRFRRRASPGSTRAGSTSAGSVEGIEVHLGIPAARRGGAPGRKRTPVVRTRLAGRFPSGLSGRGSSAPTARNPTTPTPRPVPTTRIDDVAGERPELERQDPEEAVHDSPSGAAASARIASVTPAPRRPTKAPSKMNGQRMNASDAPTRRMISISSRRATTASRIVFTMMKSTTNPTRTRTTTPPVRRTFVTEVRRSTSCWTSTTSSTTSVARRQEGDDRLVVASVDERSPRGSPAAGCARGSR